MTRRQPFTLFVEELADERTGRGSAWLAIGANRIPGLRDGPFCSLEMSRFRVSKSLDFNQRKARSRTMDSLDVTHHHLPKASVERFIISTSVKRLIWMCCNFGGDGW